MFTFDYNGNILTQQRYEGSTFVDNLSYQYATNSAGDLLSNRLYSVDDAVTNASLSATDMEDMPAYNNATPNTSNNYTYTQIGELKSDAQEEIQEIVWRVDSKISEIVRTSGSAKKNLKFEYDAMGNRVAKHVYAGSLLESSTYYVRDAQGNVMGVYEHKMDAANAVMEYKLIERNIYGSAQVGICKDTVDLNITNSSGALTQATYYHARQLNHRQYSLSNHLGNVLTTLGDGKAPVDSNSDGVIDYYVAYIISVSDYSPFGVELASRTWSIEEYRSGFQKQEKDKELWDGAMYYKYRVEDPRLGRFFSVDPLYAKYPYNSNYAFSENVVINAVELEGLENTRVYNVLQDGTTNFSHFDYDKENEYSERYVFWDGKSNKIKEEKKSLTYDEFKANFIKIKKTNLTKITENEKENSNINNGTSELGDGLPNWIGNSINAAGVAAGTFENAYNVQAGQTLRYGQRINGVVRSAQTLTRANSISSLSAAKTFSRAGAGLSIFSAGATVIDAIDRREWQTHHTADLAINTGIYATAASFPGVGWIAGAAYFTADLATQYYTGKSITQNIFDE